MVTRTVLCVTSAEAAAFASRGSIIQQASEKAHSTNGNNDENGGEQKRDLQLPSVAGDPLSRGNNNENRGRNNKRHLPSEDVISGEEIKKRQKADGFVLDLSDVPPQPPIPKSGGRMKEGASKYAGVRFSRNKWKATIQIGGKNRHIGYYENEEEAAIDYARAVFKYKGQDVLNNLREQTSSGPSINIDLSDAPPQLPILKSADRVKQGASKYAGVTFHKARNKWQSQILIEGEKCYIGYYESEVAAAIDYARAVFKYKGQEAIDKAREQNSSGLAVDLSDVPPQPPIPKSDGHIKEGSSKYTGVSFNKAANKWQAGIMIEGIKGHIGCYENEEEAAIDYARAVFKYKRAKES
jgi:hypothetical protein